MDIEVTQHQGRVPVTVLHLTGDLNVNSYEQLEARAREAHAAGAHNLLIDLSAVRSLSSAGIRAINNIFQLLRTDVPAESDAALHAGLRDGTFKSAHLKLLRPHGTVREVLSMAGIDMFIEIHDDLPQALASF